jgi:hypothetical protein
MRIFLVGLGAAAAFILWFCAFQDGSAAVLTQRAADVLDSRPARSILIVGNSRTFRNDMPAMLREIADSANSATKFQIESSSYPGATFKTHWNNTRTRRLLDDGWDDVILQAESAAQTCQPCNEDFLFYGPKLADAARLREGRPRLVVGWPYDQNVYEEPFYADSGFGRADHVALLKEMHAKLASNAQLGRINVAGPWEAIRLSHPSIKLTSDGNHPTVAGTYLYALATYAQLSNGPVAAVSYVPDGVSVEDAKAIRDAVDSTPQLY